MTALLRTLGNPTLGNPEASGLDSLPAALLACVGPAGPWEASRFPAGEVLGLHSQQGDRLLWAWCWERGACWWPWFQG